MARVADLALNGAAALATATLALALAAQSTDAPRAPRILEGSPGTPAVSPALSIASLRPPSATRLAPLPAERRDEIEEIVVIGQGWRLPDLGSEWRARQEEAAEAGRLRFTALPLYDPSRPPLRADPSFESAEERRHGYIELFRLRFGRRTRD